MTRQEIAQPVMRSLLDQGAASALVEGHFPVPVRYRDIWWHVSSDGAPDRPFTPAAPDFAVELEEMHRRLRVADEVVGSGGR